MNQNIAGKEPDVFENLYKASLLSYKFFKKFMIFLTKEDEEFIED